MFCWYVIMIVYNSTGILNSLLLISNVSSHTTRRTQLVFSTTCQRFSGCGCDRIDWTRTTTVWLVTMHELVQMDSLWRPQSPVDPNLPGQFYWDTNDKGSPSPPSSSHLSPHPQLTASLPLCPHIPQIHFFCLGSTFICMYNKIVVSYTKVCQSICIIIWAYCMFTQNNNSNDNNRNNNNNKSNPSPFVYTMDQWEGV